MTKKEKLLSALREFANTDEYQAFGLEVSMPNCPNTEQIINPVENFNFKADYIERAYNDDLELISFPSIKIVDSYFVPSVNRKRNETMSCRESLWCDFDE